MDGAFDVSSKLRERPGEWALVFQDSRPSPDPYRGIPSQRLMDAAAEISLGDGPWAPAGAFEAAIREDTDLYARFISDSVPDTEVAVTYRVSLRFGPCFYCGRPAPYLVMKSLVLLCALCAVEAAVQGEAIGRLQRDKV